MSERTIEDVFAERDELEAKFWKRSEELNDEFDRLINEL